MRKVISILLVISSIFTLIACTSKGAESRVEVSEIAENIKKIIAEDLKAVGITEESFKLEELPGYMILDLTKEEDRQMFNMVNGDDIKSGIVIQPTMNLSSDMIVILKAKEASKVEGLKKSLEEVKEAQINSWKEYLPDQYEKVNQNIIKVKGEYLIYITYKDAKEIEDIFEDSLK